LFLHALQDSEPFDSVTATKTLLLRTMIDKLYQRFPTFLTRGALFRINFYGGTPCLPYVLQVNGV